MNMHLTYNRQVIMEFLEKKKKVRKNHVNEMIYKYICY